MVVLIAAALAAVHLPPVQARLIGWALGKAEVASGMALTVESASFNLFTREASARHVTVAALDSRSEPFLTAEAVEIKVPIGALFGGFRIDRVAISAPLLTVTRARDGTLNLPRAGNGSGTVDVPDLTVGQVRDLRAEYRDEATGMVADASGVSLDLSAASGVLSGSLAARSSRLAIEGLELHDGTLAATLRYDGRVATFDDVSYDAGFEGGHLSARGRFTSDRLQIDGHVGWNAVQMAALTQSRLPVAVAARASGAADLVWPITDGLEALHLTLDNQSAPETASNGAVAIAGRLALEIAGGEWHARHDHEVMDLGRASGDARGRIDAEDVLGSTLDGSLKIDIPDVARAARTLGRLGVDVPSGALPSAGRLSADLTLARTIGSPSIAGTADATGVALGEVAPLDGSSTFAIDFEQATARAAIALDVPTLAGQDIGRVNARLSYADGRLHASEVVLAPNGGRIRLTGELSPGNGAYSIDATVETFDLRPVQLDGQAWPVAASISGELSGRGTLGRPSASGHLSISRIDWDGGAIPAADLDVTVANGRVRGRASIPELATVMDASVALDAPHEFDATAVTSDGDIARILAAFDREWPEVARQLAGSVSGEVSARGMTGALEEAEVTGALTRLDLSLADATVTLEEPATFGLDDRRVTVNNVALRSGGTTIRAAGTLGPGASAGSITLAVDGQLEDARPWLALAGVPADLATSGRLNATVSASGSLDRPVLGGRVQVRDGRVTWASYPEATNVSVDATIGEGLLDVGSIAASWEGAEARGRLQVPLALLSERLSQENGRAPGPATFSGQIDGITERALAQFLEPDANDTLTGRADARIELSAEALALDRLRGSVVLDEFAVDADGVPVTQVRPTRLDIEGTTVRVAEWSWEADGNRFDVTGSAELGEPGALDLQADGRLDLRMLGAVLPDVTTTGLADLSLRVGGTPSSPLVDGTADIRGAAARLADPQVALTDVEGHLVLTADRVELTSAEGSVNGGRFTASGTLEHQSFSPTGASLVVTASNVALNVPQGLRTEVESELTLTMADGRVRLSGTVAIERGAYREPLSLAMSLLGSARQRATETASVAGSPAFANRLDLDVALTSREDLIVDNNYGRMDIGLDLRLVGTAERPAVVGRATIRDGGVLYLGGRAYQVDRGTIDFSNPRAIVPDLDLVARTRIAGVDISLAIAGTPETMRGTLSSDPPLGQADIVSLLATGRLADEAGGAGAAVASTQLLAYLSGEALGFAAQAIGLDTLRLERGAGVDALQNDPSLIAGDTDPTTRLTVSKRFSTYAEVILSRNLAASGEFTWVASFFPRRNIELRMLSLDDRSQHYEVRHDLSFGGPPAVASAGRTPPERVASVTFTGNPGFTEQELLGQIKLAAGNRFDFYQWQKDRENLRRFYVDREYFEAHITARRADADSSTVALQYEIDRGPRTVIDIEGFSLPSAALGRLREIWSNAIFDEALIADLSDEVRREMAGRGYLRAQVAVDRPVTTPANGSAAGPEKRVRIEIMPGSLSRSRVIRISGNEAITTERLRELATTAAWLRTATLRDDVTALYHREGWLAAMVEAGPIEFDGDRAILPLTIQEGPLFTVADVRVSGAVLRTEADVRQAFGLEAGSPYSDAAVDRARAALEADYAAHGFNEIVVSTETTVDRGTGTVALAVDVDEGPRQVLRSVDVVGGDGLDPGIVDRVLKLEEGTPVNLEDWYGARRRVFDLGVFRSVDIQPVPIEGAGGEPNVEPVEARVTLVRQPVWRLRYGFDVSNELVPASDTRQFGAGVTVDLQRRGVFGHPGTVGVTGRYDRDDRIGRSYVTFPTFFGRALRTSLFAERSRQLLQQEGYLSIVADKTRVTAEQRFTAWRSLQVAYGYQFEWNHTFFESAVDFFPSFDETARRAAVTTTAIVDTRPDPFEPTSGLFHSSGIEYGGAALGSDVHFLKYVAQQFVYVPLGPIVAASGIRLGLGAGFGQDLLPSDRFFTGGVNTVRGYPEGSLGAKDIFGDPVGGQSMVVLNQEVRFPIFRWVGGAGFIDAGNVFELARDLSFTDLAVGGGGGLRLSTPVGLIRLDLAVPLPRNRRSPRLYFSFGQIF
jgi:outer membrane protein assembly complex protein YaeT